MTVKNIDKVMKYSLQWMENNQRMRINIPTDTTVTRTFKYQMATEPNSLAMQLFDAQNRLIPINGKDYYIVRPSLGMTTIELNVGQGKLNFMQLLYRIIDLCLFVPSFSAFFHMLISLGKQGLITFLFKCGPDFSKWPKQARVLVHSTKSLQNLV